MAATSDIHSWARARLHERFPDAAPQTASGDKRTILVRYAGAAALAVRGVFGRVRIAVAVEGDASGPVPGWARIALRDQQVLGWRRLGGRALVALTADGALALRRSIFGQVRRLGVTWVRFQANAHGAAQAPASATQAADLATGSDAGTSQPDAEAMPQPVAPLPRDPAWAYNGQVHKLVDIEGIGPVNARKLEALGIEDTAQLCRADPAAFAAALDMGEATLRQWQSMAELLKVKGIGPQFAEVLALSGVTGIADLRHRPAPEIAAAAHAYVAGQTRRPIRVDVTAHRVEQFQAAAKQLRRRQATVLQPRKPEPGPAPAHAATAPSATDAVEIRLGGHGHAAGQASGPRKLTPWGTPVKGNGAASTWETDVPLDARPTLAQPRPKPLEPAVDLGSAPEVQHDGRTRRPVVRIEAIEPPADVAPAPAPAAAPAARAASPAAKGHTRAAPAAAPAAPAVSPQGRPPAARPAQLPEDGLVVLGGSRPAPDAVASMRQAAGAEGRAPSPPGERADTSGQRTKAGRTVVWEDLQAPAAAAAPKAAAPRAAVAVHQDSPRPRAAGQEAEPEPENIEVRRDRAPRRPKHWTDE